MKFRMLFLVVTLLLGSTGCAFAGIGAGIGSAFPKTERVSEPEPSGTTSGRFVRDNGEALVLQRHDELVTIGREHVKEVRKRKGNHWLEGFLIGGAFDLIASGLLAYVAVQGFGSGLSAMGGM